MVKHKAPAVLFYLSLPLTVWFWILAAVMAVSGPR